MTRAILTLAITLSTNVLSQSIFQKEFKGDVLIKCGEDVHQESNQRLSSPYTMIIRQRIINGEGSRVRFGLTTYEQTSDKVIVSYIENRMAGNTYQIIFNKTFLAQLRVGQNRIITDIPAFTQESVDFIRRLDQDNDFGIRQGTTTCSMQVTNEHIF